MKRIVSSFTPPVVEPTEPDFIQTATSIDELTVKCFEILRREVTNLLMESSRGKLNPTSAKSLTDYVKLLKELKLDESEELEKLSREHLEKLASKT